VDAHLVTPGERVTLRVRGTVQQPLTPDADPLLVRVRVVAWGGGVIYEIGSRSLGLPLPDLGPFDAEVEFQCNLGPGTYRIDALSLDVRTHHELSNVATTFVSVSDGSPPFGGVAQLNGRMRRLDAAPAVVPAGHRLPAELAAEPG
jgi:hypothetical protein